MTDRLTISEVKEIPTALRISSLTLAENDVLGYAVALRKERWGRHVRDAGYYDEHCLEEAKHDAERYAFEASSPESDYQYARVEVIYRDGCRWTLPKGDRNG